MNKTVEKGKTLLVDGPASVILTSGQAEVFGSAIGTAGRLVVREGKRLPFAVEETASFDISLGENAAAEETEGTTIPQSWVRAYEELTSIEAKPIAAMVLGPVDSGKSSFCTFLINKLLRDKRKTAILDGDLGQSDIGPPCTVSYTFVAKPVTDLFTLTAKDVFFIGVTSPSQAIGKIVEGLKTLKKEMLASDPEFIIINTDGWVEEENAVYYKIKLVEELAPDVVFCIQQKDEMATILKALEKFRKTVVESPSAAGQRNRERRKNLRELGYVKFLKKAKVESIPLSWVKVEQSEVFGLDGGRGSAQRARKIYELLGMKPLHFVELKDKISVIIGKNRWIAAENVRKVEDFAKKKLVIIRKGEEQGILAAIYDAKRKFRGIGTVQEIDYLRKTLKILTPVSGEIGMVVMGKVKLDKNLKETPAFTDEDDFPSLRKLF